MLQLHSSGGSGETTKALYPFFSGGGSFFQPNLPNPVRIGSSESPHSRYFKTDATFSSDFVKNGLLSRDFGSRARTEYDSKERKDKLFKDLESAKINAERMKTVEKMMQATDDINYVVAGAYSIGEALLKEENDPENALALVKWAVGVCEKGETKRPRKLAVCLNLLGDIYRALYQFNEASDCFSRSLGILDSIKDNGGYSGVWSTMKSAHVSFVQTEMAIGRKGEAASHLTKELEILEIKLFEERKEVLAFGYMDVARLYVLAVNYKEALPSCLKALKLHIELGWDVRVVAIVRLLLIQIYSELGELEKAHEQEELAGVLDHCNSGSLDSLIDSAKMLIAWNRWPDAMKILECPLGATYALIKQHGGQFSPELQNKLEEARELWRRCEGTGFIGSRLYEEFEDFDLGKDPSIV